ncbi:MAG: DUF6498-containing protein [Methanomicrobiales archaeon]|nr:DUF6498-containing protein [Methanomicrobiales archaeon]
MGNARLDLRRVFHRCITWITVVSLVLANGITIILAVVNHWDLGTLLYIYWFQSVSIGISTVLQILALRERDLPASDRTAWLGRGGDPKDPPIAFTKGKFLVAGFFSLHYGVFHAVYLIFLVALPFIFGTPPSWSRDILIACTVFFVNHLISSIMYRQTQQVGFSELFSGPYERIIPMHLTIVLGFFVANFLAATGITATSSIIILFLGLKMVVDVRQHIKKHADRPPRFPFLLLKSF